MLHSIPTFSVPMAWWAGEVMAAGSGLGAIKALDLALTLPGCIIPNKTYSLCLCCYPLNVYT